MVLNATFNNISVILWRSVLLVEESRLPGENHQPVASNAMLFEYFYGLMQGKMVAFHAKFNENNIYFSNILYQILL
jgi:hypothetical protein